jgi:hypothetical protein
MKSKLSSNHLILTSSGFALPVVLIVSAALLILAIGALCLSSTARESSHAFVDLQRAELAAATGLSDVKDILVKGAANDDFAIIQSTRSDEIVPGAQSTPYLSLVRGSMKQQKINYHYSPLFSSKHNLEDNDKLTTPELKRLISENNPTIQYVTLPNFDQVEVAWIPIRNEKGEVVSRYAFWVEDLQSRLDPLNVSNQKGKKTSHAREKWPFPAAGVNAQPASDEEHPLNQVALYAIDPEKTQLDQGSLQETLWKNKKLLVSPMSILAASGVEAPWTRAKEMSSLPDVKVGQLINPQQRMVEEAFSVGLKGYFERPTVPFSPGVSADIAGKPKLNLNQLLMKNRDSAVTEMAERIESALPDFIKRKGGFPEEGDQSYLKTLAASALDYADEDSDCTLGNEYRGMDSFPLVSEFLMRFKIDSIAGSVVKLNVATYAELWNMSDQNISGTVQMTHETHYKCSWKQQASFADLGMLETEPILLAFDGHRWLPEISIELLPNEQRVYKFGEVIYKIDVGAAKITAANPLKLDGDDFGESNYHLRWNGNIIDRAHAGVGRREAVLPNPKKGKQAVRATVPGLNYPDGNQRYLNNPGDPRMAYYIKVYQAANAFPKNYSPNSRNIRWDIYDKDGPQKMEPQGRVLPSEWPDGGHNAACSGIGGARNDDDQLEPDDPVFMTRAGSQVADALAEEAPMRISNRGRFYSATELGRVFDPVQWQVDKPEISAKKWGDVSIGAMKDSRWGGGNTLRIGRPEHPMFDQEESPGMAAYRLLDLFHVGHSQSGLRAEREGPLVKIQGHVNLNTASREALRAIAYGALVMDPKLEIETSDVHDVVTRMAAPTELYEMTDQEIGDEADRVVGAILESRKTKPLMSTSDLARIRDEAKPMGSLVFGNKALMRDGKKVSLSDSAAEEMFGRFYEATTVRSRNFRVWTIGQCVAPERNEANLKVLAETRKAYTIFADPGKRTEEGEIDPANYKIQVLHECPF